MSFFDFALLAISVFTAVAGFRLGFVARMSSWLGLGIGLYFGVLILPFVIDQLGPGNAPLGLGISISVLIISALIGQAIGFAVGGKFAPRNSMGTWSTVDHAAGAIAGVAGAVIALWLLIPLLTSGPTWIAQQTSNSIVARSVSSALGPSPDAVRALQGVIGDDSFPQVFDLLRPTPDFGSPPLVSGLSPELEARISKSIVKLESQACNRLQDGSGFFVREDLVVTNAHVVAGQSETVVELDDLRRVVGKVVAFDPARDLAAVQLPTALRPALTLTPNAPAADVMGAVFGHPGGGTMRIAPFRVARTITATGRDIYNERRTNRQVEELVASLAPGDSGSPAVNQQGQVVGVAFAIARDQENVAYALSPPEVRKFLETVSDQPVSTGRCL